MTMRRNGSGNAENRSGLADCGKIYTEIRQGEEYMILNSAEGKPGNKTEKERLIWMSVRMA